MTARACGATSASGCRREDREVAREMRMRAAAYGLRAPVQVMEGNYKLMSGTCAWWDGVREQELAWRPLRYQGSIPLGARYAKSRRHVNR